MKNALLIFPLVSFEWETKGYKSITVGWFKWTYSLTWKCISNERVAVFKFILSVIFSMLLNAIIIVLLRYLNLSDSWFWFIAYMNGVSTATIISYFHNKIKTL